MKKLVLIILAISVLALVFYQGWKPLPSENTVPQQSEVIQIQENVPIVTTEYKEEIVDEVLPNIFGEDFSLKRDYIQDSIINYVVFTPSVTSKDTSLIVWLHGIGERWISAEKFQNRSLPKVLSNWSLEPFNAYVICPHLTSNLDFSSWSNSKAEQSLRKLIDDFITSNEVNPNKVYIVGTSLGGTGVQYLSYYMEDVFTKGVVLNGYQSSVDLRKISIPIKGYVGMISYGEDSKTYKYMTKVFEADNLQVLESSHGDLPAKAFLLDENNNGRSDLIEWLFSES